jgi:hypothetical protein
VDVLRLDENHASVDSTTTSAVGAVRRLAERTFPVTDPLGLTPEQREDGMRRLTEDVVSRATKTMGDLMEQITERARRNRQTIEALPPGTIVRIVQDGHNWPDRTREQLLEEML